MIKNNEIFERRTLLISFHQEKRLCKDQISKRLKLWFNLYIYLYSFFIEFNINGKIYLRRINFVYIVTSETAWFLSNLEFL